METDTEESIIGVSAKFKNNSWNKNNITVKGKLLQLTLV